MPPDTAYTYCLTMFGAGHVCARAGLHNAEHRCTCGAASATWMVTRPGTQVQYEVAVPRSARRCWRCRWRRRLRRPEKHWNCVAPPDLQLLEAGRR